MPETTPKSLFHVAENVYRSPHPGKGAEIRGYSADNKKSRLARECVVGPVA
jgi:hypothetical protein